MSAAATGLPTADPIFERLEDQIRWYDQKSTRNMRWFKRLKITEILAAAAIPFLAVSNVPDSRWITGALGMLITVLEGMLQLNQYHENWIGYRSTCESLKHEKFTFLAHAAPYSNVSDPRALLAERIESLVSQEHAKWASIQQQEPRTKPA
ncbi:MAG: DUF4231 domain-containing protein [Candidatus Korobacteraceae bacterium]